jgi:hypothetical protein
VKQLLWVFLVLIIAPAAIADPSCRRGFRFAEATVTGFPISSAAYGDFNEDGRPDIAVMMSDGSRIVTLNRGGHVFEPLNREQPSGVSQAGPLVTATDVNRDGHLDLVYRVYNVITVALGNGNGSFQQPRVTILRDNTDQSWRLVDFNHDGLLDFIGSDFSSSGITYVQSAGDGTFLTAAQVPLGSSSGLQSITAIIGDFDGDGQYDYVRIATDLTTFNATDVERFGWNDGTFHFTQSDERLVLPHSVRALDIDGDGAEELVAIDNGSLVIGHARNRRLTVERIAIAPPGTSPSLTDAVMTDANGDGIRDLVFSSRNAICIVPGTAGGSFGAAMFYEVPGSRGLTVADLDGDGRADFAPTFGADGLSVLYGGTLINGPPNSSRVYATGFLPSGFEHVDVDGDGILDLVAISGEGSMAAEVLFGDGTGAFPRYGKPFTISDSKYNTAPVFAADYDGDGRADLAIAPYIPGVAKPLLTFASAAGFDGPTSAIDADTIVGRVSLGSSTPSGIIALRGDDVQLITVSSGRQLTANTIYHRAAGDRMIVVRTPPGMPAQIAAVSQSAIRLVTRDGDVWRETSIATQFYSVSWIAAADLDGDGRTDYVVIDSTLRTFYGTADQHFEQRGSGGTWGFIDSATPVDFDHDGLIDIVVTSRQNFGDPGFVQVLRNQGSRNFESYAMSMTAAPYRNGVVVDDIDGDGWVDVVIPSFDGADVLTNSCVTPRLAVALAPGNPVEGGHVQLVVHALSTDGFAVGGIYIEEAGKTLTTQQPNRAYDLATIVWSSPALTAGAHMYTIRYQDQFEGTSETTVTFSAYVPPPRRRAGK